MKRLFFLGATFIVAMTATAQVTFAGEEDENTQGIEIQDQRKSTMSIGLKFGGNYSTMTKYDDVDLGLKGRAGFETGVIIGARFGKRTKGSDPGTGPLGVQIEALYALHGIKTGLDDNIKLSYFEVPVIFKYYFFQNLHVEAGVSFAGLLSSSPDYLTAILNEPFPGRQQVSIAMGDFKGFDIRPALGLGYTIPKVNLGLNARYYFGTSNMAGNFPCKVSSLEFALSWSFNIFKF